MRTKLRSRQQTLADATRLSSVERQSSGEVGGFPDSRAGGEADDTQTDRLATAGLTSGPRRAALGARLSALSGGLAVWGRPAGPGCRSGMRTQRSPRVQLAGSLARSGHRRRGRGDASRSKAPLLVPLLPKRLAQPLKFNPPPFGPKLGSCSSQTAYGRSRYSPVLVRFHCLT